MNASKRKKLEAVGFRVGDAEDFLDLTPEERELVDLRLRISRLVRQKREEQKLTQKDLAARIKSNQSRIAKLESGAGDVSLDLMFRGFFAVGGKLSDVTAPPKRKRPSLKARVKLPAKQGEGVATA